jgi:hypothetical protein
MASTLESGGLLAIRRIPDAPFPRVATEDNCGAETIAREFGAAAQDQPPGFWSSPHGNGAL